MPYAEKPALLDNLYSKFFGWLWVNGVGVGSCQSCCGGRQWYPGKPFIGLLTPYHHKVDGKLVRCRSPWFYRRRRKG